MSEWEDIVNKYGSLVWHTVYRLLGDDAEAADCYQEAFLSAVEFSKSQRVRNCSALLTRLATSKAIDRLRIRFRRSERNMNPANLTVLPSSTPGPARQVQNWELAAELRKAISQLPRHEAEVFCLRHLNDLSYRQIGRELGITANSAGVLLHRARKRLQEFFEQGFDEKGGR